jgi:hypothetical protein
MPNFYTSQILKDTTTQTVIKLTGKFDGTGQESNTIRIQANTLYGALDKSRANLLSSAANTGPLPYYGLAIQRVWYDCASSTTSDVELFWTAPGGSNNTIFFLNSNGEYDGGGNWITIPNSTSGIAGSNGDIGITTRGMVANDSYTLVIELRKDNAQYQRGQINDPAAFNYPPYNLKP